MATKTRATGPSSRRSSTKERGPFTVGLNEISYGFDGKGGGIRCNTIGCKRKAVFWHGQDSDCVKCFNEHIGDIAADSVGSEELTAYLKVLEAIFDWYFVGRKRAARYTGEWYPKGAAA